MNKQLKTAYEKLIKEHGKTAGVLAPLQSALDASDVYLPSRISELDLDRIGSGFYYSRNKTFFLLAASFMGARYTAYQLTKASRLKKLNYFDIYDDILQALENLCPNQEFTTDLDEAMIKINNQLGALRLNISDLKEIVKKDSKD